MADVETRLDRIEHQIERLAGVTGEMARELRSLVQGLAADRNLFRDTLRELSGFVATAGLEMNQLRRTVETGFSQMQMLLGENNRLITENNRQIAENNRQITENNAVIRRLLDILARGRGNGEGPPQ